MTYNICLSAYNSDVTQVEFFPRESCATAMTTLIAPSSKGNDSDEKTSTNGHLTDQSVCSKRKIVTEHEEPVSKVSKRTDYLSWDEYFMAVAFLSAQRSKDPSSQVGACIVNSDKKIVGIGYNGMPNGCSDDLLPWDREASDEMDTKYPYGKTVDPLHV